VLLCCLLSVAFSDSGVQSPTPNTRSLYSRCLDAHRRKARRNEELEGVCLSFSSFGSIPLIESKRSFTFGGDHRFNFCLFFWRGKVIERNSCGGDVTSFASLLRAHPCPPLSSRATRETISRLYSSTRLGPTVTSLSSHALSKPQSAPRRRSMIGVV
jgi:hypothetical protein